MDACQELASAVCLTATFTFSGQYRKSLTRSSQLNQTLGLWEKRRNVYVNKTKHKQNMIINKEEYTHKDSEGREEEREEQSKREET